MLGIALLLFAAAAIGGGTLTWMHLKNDDAPIGFAAVHGVLAASGLVLLLWTVLQNGAAGLLWGSVILFVLAALGGFVLITKHLRGESLTAGLMLGHGGIAVLAFLLLVVAYFS